MTFIKYFNSIKFARCCIDCKHYLITGPNRGANIYATAKCTRVIYKCSDTGVNKFEYAYITRSNEKMCGPNGINFSPLVRREN